ncbi:pyridoxamine 5'-phosphate oxidase family protein [Sphingomonas sp. ID0503]|uniref:pyridoxamine 5'-phosphate oxidase family protein n=1 Tax=Sphingomonas sp. ID0503 TaxID=3399691 RepID=UPI003AFA0DD5
MPTAQELEAKFWSSLASDMTMMIGLDGVEDGHARPMTAIVEGDHGPIWFFSSRENVLTQKLSSPGRAIATFTSKGHDIFATVHGTLQVDNDPVVIDRLWNPHVAAWYEEGKNDPKLALLRLDPEKAEIWKDGSSLFAGVLALFGSDPKKDYKDNVAEVSLA